MHHGLWDYDFTSPPNLVTITVDGKRIDAVAEVSKQGFTYVFDRVTGQPVWPIEERPVDTTTDVPGERPYPTQPFPTKPPPFSAQGISLDDANDLTPEIKALAIGGNEEVPPRAALHAAEPARHDPAADRRRAGPIGGRGVRSRDGTALPADERRRRHVNQVCKNDGSAGDVDVDYTNNCEYGAADNIFQRPDGAPAPARRRTRTARSRSSVRFR